MSHHIHPTAVIDPEAKIASDVQIGPYCIIGPYVEIAEGTKLLSHVVIQGPCKIGRNNLIYPFASLGGDPQDLKYQKGENVCLEIGDGNTIRESVTMHRGTVQGGGYTRIGDNNLFMAYCHIAHDVICGNQNVLANGVQLAGHVQIENHVVIGGLTAIQQFVRIGNYAYIGGHTALDRDWPPFCTGFGNRAKVHGVNVIGLKRRGFTKDAIRVIQEAQRIYYKMNLSHGEALAQLEELSVENSDMKEFLQFVQESKAGITPGRVYHEQKD